MPRFLLATLLLFGSVATADTVTLTGSDQGAGQILVDGQVVEYTGREIVIERGVGGERKYPADRVLKIETNWPAGWQEGLDALDSEQYATAVDRFASAARTDQRAWVRRLAMQHLLHCYAATGDQATAGQLLVNLAASDPATPALAEAPLAWHSGDRIPAATADEWMANTNSPVAQLLGASHALSGSNRTQALNVLKTLARSSDPRVAWLAEMQTWRADLVTAKPDDVARRDRRLRQAPESLQAGGWLVLGDTQRQLKEYDPAALSYLRTSLLAEPQPQLAAHALWRASQALRLAGHDDEANQLAHQLLDEYPKTAPAREAEGVIH